MPKRCADDAEERNRVHLGRRLEHEGQWKEQRPADRRTEQTEEEHELDRRREELPRHCANSFRPALTSTDVCASWPS